MSTEKLIIFDTTMRDGEQSPGASMTKDEKLRIARALERMRIDVQGGGFTAKRRTWAAGRVFGPSRSNSSTNGSIRVIPRKTVGVG